MSISYENIACTRLDDESKASLKKLLEQAYDSENSDKRLRSLIWTCEKNPHAGNDESRYYFITANRDTLAYNGRMPVNILFKGKTIHAYFVHETLVSLDYRRKGLGIQVNKNVLRHSRGLCPGLWANEKLLPLLLKIGWTAVGELKPLRKIVRIEKIAKYKFRSRLLVYLFRSFGRIYLRMRKRKHEILSSNIRIFEITKFTDDMQQPLDNIMKNFHILAYRNPDYLNWKYIDIPYKQYKVYGVKRNGVLKGYIVLRTQVNNQKDLIIGMIVDLLCDPREEDCFFSLLMKAEEYFSNNGSDFIVCMLTYDRFRDWIRELGFYEPRVKTKDFFLLANIDQIDDKTFAKDFSNWYLTYGDSDYDMLIGELKAETG